MLPLLATGTVTCHLAALGGVAHTRCLRTLTLHL
jgi:hypothetical protein